MIRLHTIKTAVVILFSLSSFNAFSQDITFNDDQSPLVHPINDDHLASLYNTNGGDNSKTDLLAMFKYITPVRHQGKRNTCTVFSITALLEAMYLKKYTAEDDVDLSEQWGQYLASLNNASGGARGSTVRTNFRGIEEHGISTEEVSAYNRDKWSTEDSEPQRICRALTGLSLTRCLYGQMHPGAINTSDERLKELGFSDFVTARDSAEINKENFINGMTGGVVSRVSSIKQKLRNNTPMTLEINIYYGAWSLARMSDKLGIAHDPEAYLSGIVSYPEAGSVDRVKSRERGNTARHSVLIVGYDDDKVITYTKNMSDGTVKTFTRKGIYYFKNSWGSKYGNNFRYGRFRYPGFGIMSQEYAHEFGQFFRIDLAQSL